MLVPMYVSFIIPLVFLIVAIKDEGRSLVLSFAWGLSSTVIMYFSGVVFDYANIPIEYQTQYLIPSSEELIKILPLFFLMFTKRKIGPYTISRCAMAMGIGFSIMENFLYVSGMESSGAFGTIMFAVARSLTTALLHGSTTAIIGYIFQVMRQKKTYSICIMLSAWLGMSIAHSLYNTLWSTEKIGILAIFIPFVLFLFNLFGINGFGIMFKSYSRKMEG